MIAERISNELTSVSGVWFGSGQELGHGYIRVSSETTAKFSEQLTQYLFLNRNLQKNAITNIFDFLRSHY